MFTGTTIQELVTMVRCAEASVEAKQQLEAEFASIGSSTYTVYSYEQLKQYERASALMGVA